MNAWMSWAMIVEAPLLSAVLALTLAWSALRAVFHLLSPSHATPRLAPVLRARRSPARAA
jgi:hypothetical protein